MLHVRVIRTNFYAHIFAQEEGQPQVSIELESQCIATTLISCVVFKTEFIVT